MILQSTTCMNVYLIKYADFTYSKSAYTTCMKGLKVLFFN